MFAITIDLLAGRYVATSYNDRERVEWPPHPARLFSALVATWAEDEPDSSDGRQELSALRWLERQSPPEILASTERWAGHRSVVPIYVPVNDAGVVSAPSRDKLDAAEIYLGSASDSKALAKAEKELKKLQQKFVDDTAKAVAPPIKANKGDGAAAAAVFPDRRTRQPRTFPSATPECEKIAFLWSAVELDEELRPGMARLLSRLVRLGHSSTFVHGSIADAAAIGKLEGRTSRYRPDDDDGSVVIRWVNEGQIEQLGRAFEQHRETEPRVLPSRFVCYREGERAVASRRAQSLFEHEFIVFARVGGPRLPITATAGVARQFRRALMSVADQPVDEMISGHQPGGGASEADHIAIVPLPVVTGPHPDGALIGLGVILPRSIQPQSRVAVMRAIDYLEKAARGSQCDAGGTPVVSVNLGKGGVLQLQRDVWGEDRRSTLWPSTWTRASKRWASATPVALDRNPGDLHHGDPARRQAAFADATACVIAAVQRVGLPAPVEIDVVRSCVLPGTAKPIAHPRYPLDAQRPQRVLVHVRLVFEEAVQGPVLVGAGRYHGLGLLLPLDSLTPRDIEAPQ